MSSDDCRPGASPAIEKFFHDCIYDTRDYIGFILGLCSIACWVVAQLPQLIKNYKRKSADALSPFFLAEWLLGDTCNLVGALLKGDQPETVILTAQYFICMDCVLLLQYLYYTAASRRLERTYALARRRRHHHHGYGQHHHHRQHSSSVMRNRGAAGGIAESPFAGGGTAIESSSVDGGGDGGIAAMQGPVNDEISAHAIARLEGGEATELEVSSEREHSKNRAGGGGGGGAKSGHGGKGKRGRSRVSAAGLAATAAAGAFALLQGPAALGGHGVSQIALRRSLSQAPAPPGLPTGSDAVGEAQSLLASDSRNDGILSTSGTVAASNTGSIYALFSISPVARLGESLGEMKQAVGSVLGYISCVLYLTSRISQIIKNAKNQSAEGLASSMFFCAMCANVFYGSSVILRARSPEELLSSLPWVLGSLGTVALDGIILAQTYFAAKGKNRAEVGPEEEPLLGPEERHHRHSHEEQQ